MSKPIRTDTSAGYRLRKLCAGRGKLGYVFKNPTSSGHIIVASPQCIRENADALMKLEKITTFQVFADYQKDERYPLAKEDKFRGVSADDARDFFIYRQLYGVFLDALRRFRPFGKSQVGLDPTGPDFNLLAKYLREFGDNFMELDAKVWDFLLHYNIRLMFFEVADRWFELHFPNEDPVWKTRRQNFKHKYLIHYHVYHDLLYARIGGMASGLGGTAEENGFDNRIGQRMSFQDLCPTKKFDEWVRAAYYGDDLISVVADGCSEYNQMTFAKWSKEVLGMTWTTAAKETPVDEYKSFFDVSFISRQFALLDPELDVVVGKMSVENIHEIPLWVRTKDPVQKIPMFRDNCESSLREMFNHGPSMFEEWKLELNQCLLSVGANPVRLEYSQLLDAYRSKL